MVAPFGRHQHEDKLLGEGLRCPAVLPCVVCVDVNLYTKRYCVDTVHRYAPFVDIDDCCNVRSQTLLEESALHCIHCHVLKVFFGERPYLHAVRRLGIV